MAAPKKQNVDPEVAKITKSNSLLELSAQKILSTIDSGYAERQRLSRADSRMAKQFNREMNLVHNKSHGHAIDFIRDVNKVPNKNKSKGNTGINKGRANEVDPFDLFTTNAGDIFNYFKENSQSRYLEISDLKFVSKFVPILGEALKIALNSITASDTISDTIARKIEVPDMNEDELKSVLETIEAFEKDKNLLKKLKNITIKKTLVSGESYIYAIPYKDLFEEYDRLMMKKKVPAKDEKSQRVGMEGTLESFGMGFDYTVGTAFESCISDENTLKIAEEFTSFVYEPKVTVNNGTQVLSKNNGNSVKAKDRQGNIDERAAILEDTKEFIQSFKVLESTIPYPAMEDAKIYNLEKYRAQFGGNRDFTQIPDGTEVSADADSYKKQNFKDLNGVYMKFIDAKNLVAVKIFDEIFGYFYMHSTNKKSSQKGNGVGYNKTDLFHSPGASMLNVVNITESKKAEAINGLVDHISQMVLNTFSAKFVTANTEFVDLIAQVIIANGLVDKDYQIQFIPAQYIIPFKINEDENGNGESMFADALFAAKLMLYLLTTQLLNYINLSGNRQIAHFAKGPIDVSTSNHIQNVIRGLQETKVSFNDLLSTNLVYSKLSRNTNIALPQSKSGQRLVEFETQEGQDVNMDTDFLEKLEELVSIGTGVPITKDALTSPQFAKQLESENIKYAGAVASWQADLEVPITQLYKMIIEYSTLTDDIKAKCANGLMVKLPRPKAFENTNNADFLGTAVSMAQQAVSIFIGENNTDEKATSMKDKMTAMVVEDMCPFIDWNKLREMEKRIVLDIKKDEIEEDQSGDTGGGGSTGDDMGF